jgi:hypothetical protein
MLMKLRRPVATGQRQVADIDGAGAARGQDAGGLARVARQQDGLAEVAAGAERQDRHRRGRGARAVAVEEAVDHLVGRAVAAHRHHGVDPGVDRLARQAGGVARARGHGVLEGAELAAQRRAQVRPAPAELTVLGRRIHDQQGPGGGHVGRVSYTRKGEAAGPRPCSRRR